MTSVLELAGAGTRALLSTWLPDQRWWPAKGRAVTLEPVGSLRLPSDEPQVEIEVLLLALREPAGPTDYLVQVPLTARASATGAPESALVGQLEDGSAEARWIYDGTHDSAFVSAWVGLLATGGEVRSADASAQGGRPGAAAEVDPDAPSRVLRGEQSNTSIIIEGPSPAIVKLFRVVRAGDNPDVAVTTALAAAGCERVPRPVGWVRGTWRDPAGQAQREGHLTYACEFLDGSEDAYRVACRAVGAGVSFAKEAAELGGATAEVHAALAAVLPTVPSTPALLSGLADRLRGRLAWAVAEVPALATVQSAAAALFDQIGRLRPDSATAPVWQRIHGDYHLGQVLHSPARGWIVIDFEGEPLTPLAERSRPDLALRDVAGMLRSFDYAAAHETHHLPADDPAVEWADRWMRECREAFLDGYAAVARTRGGVQPAQEPLLLRAFEVDKALYEVVYETYNRPHWAGRPLRALHRLLSG